MHQAFLIALHHDIDAVVFSLSDNAAGIDQIITQNQTSSR
jgi:hypothetical protein